MQYYEEIKEYLAKKGVADRQELENAFPSAELSPVLEQLLENELKLSALLRTKGENIT